MFFFALGSSSQVVLAMILTIVFMMVTQEMRPYLRSEDYRLQVYSQLQLSSFFFLCLYLLFCSLQKEMIKRFISLCRPCFSACFGPILA